MAEVRPVHKQNNLRTSKNFTQGISKDLCNLCSLCMFFGIMGFKKKVASSQNNDENNCEKLDSKDKVLETVSLLH